MTRRDFIYTTTIISGGLMMGCDTSPIVKEDTLTYDIKASSMPEESEEHKRTWMSFVASDTIWASNQIAEVKRNLALIATTIAKYEPVSILVSRDDRDEAVELLGGLNTHEHPIELFELEMNDLWIRDTGPTFVYDENGEKSAIDLNFNGWGEDQEYALDAKVAKFVTEKANARLINSNLILEGGCFEVDGAGTAIMTESCIINDNRNPDVSKEEIEKELKSLLGLEKIIWLEGIKGKDITDGHTDFYARFVKEGVVVVSRDDYDASYDYEVTRKNIEMLQTATDSKGNPLELIILKTPDIINEAYGVDDFAAGYVGYYVCNGAVIMQSFGDPTADQDAKDALALAFPDRVIEQIAIDGIASGGGSIHCATQQECQEL